MMQISHTCHKRSLREGMGLVFGGSFGDIFFGGREVLSLNGHAKRETAEVWCFVYRKRFPWFFRPET